MNQAYDKPQYYINREMSWLEFNNRVLQEAKDKDNPFFERIKFLSIFTSNLDEFYMVRVATLKDQVSAGHFQPDASGLTPDQQLEIISLRVHELVREQYILYQLGITKGFSKNNISFLTREDINREQQSYLEEYFTNMVYPVLTPMAVDSSRPFPVILNRSLNLGVLLKEKETGQGQIFATVQVPAIMSRMVELPPSQEGKREFILLEEVITMFIDRLFSGSKIICTHPFRITRNADLPFKEDEADDLLHVIQQSLKQRKWGNAVRLEVEVNMDGRMVEVLKSELEIEEEDIFYIKGPLDLTFLLKFYAMKGYEHLKYPVYVPWQPQDLAEDDDIFESIRQKDIFLHHPYESFEPVIRFIQEASRDANVLAIKQTLYRVSGDSPIVSALSEAAESGKQVTVLVELKARFDEENNIQWAKRLEQAGCHVIYGLVGLKTHSKITLVVRSEEQGIRRYIHLGTGNYNDITAKFYTDMGIFTCNEKLGADASALFNMLSGYSEPPGWYNLAVAPLGLREKLMELIENETAHALQGKKARIMAKMNSLVDTEIIKALYKASAAGVKTDLIIRGICCLRPGIQGTSENITVKSIVGRFLEHSRVFYFYNDGQEELFLSSADWMPRNLDYRVELMFPLENKDIKERVTGILDVMLEDSVKARVLNKDGQYKKVDKRGKKKLLNAQEYFCEIAAETERKNRNTPGARFIPITLSEA